MSVRRTESFTVSFDVTDEDDGSPREVHSLSLTGKIGQGGNERNTVLTHKRLIEFVYDQGLFPLLRAFNAVSEQTAPYAQSEQAVADAEKADALSARIAEARDAGDAEAILAVLAEAEEAFSS